MSTTEKTNPPEIRLHKAMADAGLASRRQAERMIEEGMVRVNGQLVRDLGVKITPGVDRVEIEGHTVNLSPPRHREVWALYKPKGVVSTLSDPEGRPTIKDFLPHSRQRLFPVGRLDYDAEGLLFITNDGLFAQQVAHPSHSVSKIYLVKVKGVVEAKTLSAHAHHPVIDGKVRQPVRARILHHINQKTWLEVILKEGVKHHIKKFFQAMGHRVEKIKRFAIGPISLEDMAPGAIRRLTKQEVELLMAPPPQTAQPSGGRRAARKGRPGGSKKL